ncbi:MAG: DUF4091 domain-containing protein [Clostridia bacterium]|nr:DUF4091 domain-containing protein [Clostridia bacterium]
MKKLSPIIAMLLLLAMLLCACQGGDPSSNPETTPDDTTVDTGDDTTEQTTPAPDTDTDSEEQTTEVTEAPLPENCILDFDLLTDDKLGKCFGSPNQTTVAVMSDEGGEKYVSLSTSQANANDPYVTFDCNKFFKSAGLDVLDVTEYPYVLLKVRSVDCSSGTFEMFYKTKSMAGISGEAMVTSAFAPAKDGWQYVLFDMTAQSKWTGRIALLRLDYMVNAMAANETVQVAEVRFLPNADYYYDSLNLDMSSVGIPISDKAKADALELLAGVSAPKTSFDSYKPLTAEHEDATLSMWFDHMFNRTPKDDTTHSGMDTYQIFLAGNETEGCQVLLAPQTDVSGIKVYLTDFTNESGDTLESELRWGYYFTNIGGKDMYEPLPKVTYEPDQEMVDRQNGANSTGSIIPNFQTYDGFDIKAGNSQMFVIKAIAPHGATPGEYTATFTVTDAQGNEIKKATVFAYVWNFSLPLAPSCKTMMDLGSFGIYSTYLDYGGEVKGYNGLSLYQEWYEFMLDYRINAYSLPIDNKDGRFDNEELVKYLDDPRVQCFQTLGWKTDLNATNVSNAYAFLSQKQEWLDKAYFYPVDEPGDQAALDRIVDNANLLKQYFPGYKLIAPMHLNRLVKGGDYFSYLQDSVTAWCPHNFFFHSYAEWKANPDIYYRMPVIAESDFGPFRDRMKAEAEGGDEIWWYLTRLPNQPEITFDINMDAVNCRTVFWQQKLYDVDGFLYYSINDWMGAPEIIQDTGNEWLVGFNPVYEKRESDGIDIYGNGILLYSGIYFADRDPIPALRMECVRDGIEDYDYLTLLQDIYGEETVDGMIATWTTNMYEYSTDHEQFYALRVKLGALIEQNSK